MLIKSVSGSQDEIIRNIISLHCPSGIELDPTYSKGVFYKNSDKPKIISDLFPQVDGCVKADASQLPFASGVGSIMFDPPFIVGFTKGHPTGLIANRFYGFRYIQDLWDWYDKCLAEFHRLLKNKGVLIFKCQDTVSGGKQHFSHIHIFNKAQEVGFYPVDLFVLTAKSRMIGHNHKKQKHARKFHSYFWVFRKETNAY